MSNVTEYCEQDVTLFSVESLMESFEFAAKDRAEFTGEKFSPAFYENRPNESSFTPGYLVLIDRFVAAQNLLWKKLRALGLPTGKQSTAYKYKHLAQSKYNRWAMGPATDKLFAVTRASLLYRALKAQEK